MFKNLSEAKTHREGRNINSVIIRVEYGQRRERTPHAILAGSCVSSYTTRSEIEGIRWAKFMIEAARPVESLVIASSDFKLMHTKFY